IMNNLENYEKLFKLGKMLTSGKAGIDFCFPPHLKDASDLIKKVWEETKNSTIQNSWNKSNILPLLLQVQINKKKETNGKQNKKGKEERKKERKIANEICSSLENL